MSFIIRFGYCPPNPGPKAKIKNKWYREKEIEDAINNWDGQSEIWISYNKRPYHQISFSELCNLNKNKI